jgi:predicted kinase
MVTEESYRRSRREAQLDFAADMRPGSGLPGLGDSRIAQVAVGSGVGPDQTRLIVLRGNSGSGKSTVAKALREAYGRGVAWVAQDLIRRTILRERDVPAGINIGLIDQVTRYCLGTGYHVVLDGILYADRYEHMLAALGRDYRCCSWFYYLDVSWEETIRRHATRPQAAEFGPAEMRGWYRPQDLLTAVRERVIPETSTLPETVDTILAESRLLAGRVSRPGEEEPRPARALAHRLAESPVAGAHE